MGMCAPGTGTGRAGGAAGDSVYSVAVTWECAWKCSSGTMLKGVPVEPGPQDGTLSPDGSPRDLGLGG